MPPVSLIGRDRERILVQDALERAVSGLGGVVIVRGDPGIGKSALIAVVTARISAQLFAGFTVSADSRRGRAVADLAVAAIAAGVDLDAPSLALFRRPLAALTGIGLANDGTDPAAFGPYGAAIGEGLLRLLAAAAERVVILIEDLHWADEDTLAVVDYLAHHIHGRPAALLLTVRDGDSSTADAAAVRMGRLAGATTVVLPPLSSEDVAALTAARLDDREMPPELLTAVIDFAEGVPLLVEQFLAGVPDDRAQQFGAAKRRPPTASSRPGIPESLRDSIEMRFAEMGFVGRRLLGAGALLGRTFDVEMVARALHLDTETAVDAVRGAIRRGLVQASQPPSRVEFRHSLIRESIDAMVVPPVRAELARALLAALPRARGVIADSVVESAAHLARQADDDALAADCYLRAGRSALRRGAMQSGSTLIDEAVLLAHDSEPAIAARLARIDAQSLTGHTARALEDGAVLLRMLHDEPAIAAGVHLAMARAAAAGQLWSVARTHLDVIIDPAQNPADNPAVWSLAAAVALGAGRPQEAVEFATRATAAADDGPPEVACEAYEILGRVAREHDLAAAASWFGRAAGLAERHHLAFWRARALHELATITQLQTVELDDLVAARAAALDAGAVGLLSAVDFHIAAIHGIRFEPEPALAAARRCLEEARRTGVIRQQAWGWILIGQAHACAGRRGQAAAAADEASRLAPGDPEIAGLAVATCRGLASLLAADRDLTVEQFRRGAALLRPLPRIPLPPWYLWPLVAAVWTDDEGARALSDADHPAFRVSAGPEALWRLAAAVVAGRNGDLFEAASQSERAQQVFRALPGFEGYRHLGLRLAAEAAIADGWGDPGSWLVDAEIWSEHKGFDAFAVSCRALGRRAGGTRRRRGRGGTAVPAALEVLGVTTREADVLALVVGGLTNHQIADRLYVSPPTVKSHVESLLRKTGSNGRAQLAALAATHGLADTVRTEGV